jgi:CRP-like cAMP-binding protein
MAKPSPTLPTEPSPSRRNGEELQLQNEILLDLSHDDCKAVLSNLEFVRLKPRQVLHEAGEPLKSGYFCNSGMFSILSAMPDGKLVAVGLIGKEGFAGLPLIAGFRTALARTIVQVEATAYRVDASLLLSLLRQYPELERRLQQYAQFLTLQVIQTAACNRLHGVHDRLARWLLMTQDRIGCNSLPVTQDLLSQMIGTRRSSVSQSACSLQKARLISYTRGRLIILDRCGLEKTVCKCYDLLQQRTGEWQRQCGLL